MHKLVLYLPEGRSNAPVIVSYYGNQLMGGGKREDGWPADIWQLAVHRSAVPRCIICRRATSAAPFPSARCTGLNAEA
jgi:hypothetical protein